VVVASQSDCDVERVLSGYDAHLVFTVLDEEEMMELTDRFGDVILTDDMAPVESMLAAAVRRTVPQRLAGRYLRDAARFQAERQYDRSIASYRRAAQQDPAVTTQAYNAIALIQVEQGKRQDAIESFEHAIASHVPTGLHQTSLAAVDINLAVLLAESDRKADAKPHWDQASRLYRVSLERHPDSAYVWDRLGQTLVRAGKLSEAADAFEKTIALDPDNLANYDTLAKLLEVQKRYDDAISVSRRQLDVLKQQHQRDAVLELTQYIDFLEYQRVKE